MRAGAVAIVGAAETTELGRIPHLSNIGLNADAALNALADCGLKPSDIDGLACGYEYPTDVARYLGIFPTWIDHTSVGGCSWMIMLRHAVAAINAGILRTVLITHGESGRSRIGGPYFNFAQPGTLPEQFYHAFGTTGAVTTFTLPVVRYMREFGVTEEMLAYPVVTQRAFAALNPRAGVRTPITLEEVLAAPMIAWPFRRPMCCLVSDGGGALVLMATERAVDMPTKPVYILGTGEAYEAPKFGVAEGRDLLRPPFVRIAADLAFQEAGVSRDDVDHLMIYDAFSHCVLYGLEGLGFCDYGDAGDFIREGHTSAGGRLPTNTNGGGMSYAHSGSYGMFVLQEAVRQLRGTAVSQVHDAKISCCFGWGGTFSAGAAVILGNERP